MQVFQLQYGRDWGDSSSHSVQQSSRSPAPSTAPLQAEIDALLQGSDLEIAKGGEAFQRNLIGSAQRDAEQWALAHFGRPRRTDITSVGLQLHFLNSHILRCDHTGPIARFFDGSQLRDPVSTCMGADARVARRRSRCGAAALTPFLP